MSMTLAQAVKNCIEIEHAAERYYRRLLQNAEDADVKAFFTDMAEQEAEHAALIAHLGEQLEAGELPQRADAKIKSVERAPGWDAAEDITLAEAVDIALEAENSAALYYDAMTDFTTGQVKDFFAQLARTEEQHAEKLRKFREDKIG